MKVTQNADGSISFDTDSVSEALAIANALQNKRPAVPQASTAVAAGLEDYAGHGESDPRLDELRETREDAANERLVAEAMDLPHDVSGNPDPVSMVAAKKAAAKEAGLSYKHFIVWEYLVAHDNRRGGTTTDHVMKAFKLTRGAASQRLLHLTKAGYAVRVGIGKYRAAMP